MWIKITDEQGKVDVGKLPKEYTHVWLCRETTGDMKEAWIDNTMAELLQHEGVWTHYSPIHGPNEPQPEDGLVDLLKEADQFLNQPCSMILPYAPCKNKGANSRHHNSLAECKACKAKARRREALAAWEAER